jgi:hypothetical protein
MSALPPVSFDKDVPISPALPAGGDPGCGRLRWNFIATRHPFHPAVTCRPIPRHPRVGIRSRRWRRRFRTRRWRRFLDDDHVAPCRLRGGGRCMNYRCGLRLLDDRCWRRLDDDRPAGTAAEHKPSQENPTQRNCSRRKPGAAQTRIGGRVHCPMDGPSGPMVPAVAISGGTVRHRSGAQNARFRRRTGGASGERGE